MTTELTEREVYLSDAVDLLENRLADAQLAIDNIGWSPLCQDLDGDEPSLQFIKDQVDLTRALVAVNPLTKRGVAVRTTYVWGKPVNFLGLEEDDSILQHPLNKKFLFSSEAHAEMEKSLATDGNFFFLASGKSGRRRKGGSRTPTGIRVPLTQITGIVTNPENPEDVWFYRREWKETRSLKTQDKQITKQRIEYFPSDLYDKDANGEPKQLQGKPVNWDSVMIEHSVNKQVGWRWGLPDVLAVIFWAKAHKEFLEDSAKLVKAYSRFAFKVTTATPLGVKAAAARVAAAPQRDAYGQQMDIGATAVQSAGSNIQAIGRTSGSVDFSAGIPLAGYVAAGLEIPLTDLLADSSLSNRAASETLSESKLASMVARQKSWVSFFDRLWAYWGKNVETSFPKIETDPTYRQVQSVMLAKSSNVFSAQEIRDLLVAAFDVKSEADLPTEEELGLMILEQKKAEEAQEKSDAEAAAAEQNKPSYGDNTNRDELAGGQNEYTHKGK